MREMKGKLKKIDDKWVVEYSGISYSGGNPKQLGSYTKKVCKKTLPLHPNFITMTDYVWVKGYKFYDGYEVEFTEVLVNSIGREVDPNNLGQNHSKCIWYARPSLSEKEDLGYTTKMGIGVSDEMVRATMIPKEYFGKEEQKQHLIDMMKDDEELGLYEQIDQNNPVTKGSTALVKKIKFEDVFNDEKREGVKRVIHQHKVLKDLSLVNPAHLQMTSNGHGEFPDSYKLTEKGIQYIIEQLNKE
jgi:hypothetical protein